MSAPNARLGAQSTTLLDTTLLDTTLLDGVAELSRIWIKAAPHAAPRPGVSAALCLGRPARRTPGHPPKAAAIQTAGPLVRATIPAHIKAAPQRISVPSARVESMTGLGTSHGAADGNDHENNSAAAVCINRRPREQPWFAAPQKLLGNVPRRPSISGAKPGGAVISTPSGGTPFTRVTSALSLVRHQSAREGGEGSWTPSAVPVG